jgi:hypothetical protein
VYEVRVLVSTLDDASKLLKVLEQEGYSQVSMGQPSTGAPVHTEALLDRAKSSLNKLNDWIVISLYKAGAVDKAHATTTDKVVSVLRILPDARELIETRGEGIVSRTVSMVASAVVGDKMALAAYEKTQPRKFWLTQEGVKKAKLLVGEMNP